MNIHLLHPKVQNFINIHLKSDLATLLFKGTPFEDSSIQEIVAQIEAKTKAEHKLPTWFKTANIYYANKLNIAQSSSEKTAQYKASLIKGSHLIDLTGGFGVDTFAFAESFNHVTYCELNQDLANITKHNFNQLGLKNSTCVAVDGLEYLEQHKTPVDWLYLDPSRRHDHKGKVFLLADCTPNLIEQLQLLFEHSEHSMVKVSPMLDLSQTIADLQAIQTIHIVAVNNEVKELLLLLKKDYQGPVSIKTVNLVRENQIHFSAEYASGVQASYALPKTYVYEPNAAILKGGLFNEVSHSLNIDKLHVNSHLYTSNKLINFPGRSFKITANIPFDKKQLHRLIPSQKANITTRNFPVSVADIRRKTKLKEGGHQYLFFTTDLENNRRVLVCEKI